MDLIDHSELFCTSVKFQNVASGLKRIIENEPVERKDHLAWAGELLRQLPFDSEYFNKGEPKVILEATKIRPQFYEARIRKEINFDKDFYDKLYETLKNPEKPTQLEPERLRDAINLFQYMADRTLSELQHMH